VTNGALLNIGDILKFLPHRYPFLLVDRVLSLDKGKSITAIKNVTYNEEFFQGHFPDVPIMPGVLQVEAIAQAGGILLFHSIPDPEKKFVLFSKIENMKFLRPVVPGDQIRLSCDLVKMKAGFVWMHGSAAVDGNVVVVGDIVALLLNREDLNVRS